MSVITKESLGGPIFHGAKTGIGIGAAVRLTETSRDADKGVLVQAKETNSGKIAIGNSNVTINGADATDGPTLAAGENIVVPVDDPSKIYITSDTASQGANWLII